MLAIQFKDGSYLQSIQENGGLVSCINDKPNNLPLVAEAQVLQVIVNVLISKYHGHYLLRDGFPKIVAVQYLKG